MKKTCSKCSEVFELLPYKPGFANVCPNCTENNEQQAKRAVAAESLRKSFAESVKINSKAHDKAMRDDAKLKSLGFEKVPGTTIMVKVPRHR